MNFQQLTEILETLEFKKDVWYSLPTINGLIQVDIAWDEITVSIHGLTDGPSRIKWEFTDPKEALLKILEFYPGLSLEPVQYLEDSWDLESVV